MNSNLYPAHPMTSSDDSSPSCLHQKNHFLQLEFNVKYSSGKAFLNLKHI